MKKLFRGAVFLALIMAAPHPKPAGAEVNVSIALPPPIFFGAPPEMIVLPETYVYVVPDVDEDVYFYDGWWWRSWDGRWYRSAYYDSGWAYYQSIPVFYVWVPSGWRNDYRDHRWQGRQWDYQRIHHQQVQKNWKGWKKEKHWEKEHTWGVKGLQPQTRSKKLSREESRPRAKEVKPMRSPQYREAGPQSREAPKQQPRKTIKSQHQSAVPHSREGRPQQQEDHERGGGAGPVRR